MFKQTVQAELQKCGDWAADVWDTIQQKSATFTQTVNASLEAVSGWVGSVWDFISGAATITKNVVVSIFGQTDNAWLGAMFGLNSPEEVERILEEDAGAMNYALQQAGLNPNGSGILSQNHTEIQITGVVDAVAGNNVVEDPDGGLYPQLPTETTIPVETSLTNNTPTLLETLKGWWDERKDKWYNKLYANPEVAGGSGSAALAAMKQMWDDGKDKWWNILYPIIQANASVGNNLHSEVNTAWTKDLEQWWNILHPTIEAPGGVGNTLHSAVNAAWNKDKEQWWNILEAKVKIKNDSSSWWSNVVSWWNNFTKNASLSVRVNAAGGARARGGSYSNGAWHDIPQYAGGTASAHGSLFIAGEAGPEIVGHIGGRTEVLNKSQLAAAMYAAVNHAMSGVTLDANFYHDNGRDAGDMEMLAEMVRVGVENAMERERELLREQNEYLRQISDKDTTVEISTNAISRGMNRMNRRAGTTIVPVGT